MQNFHVHLNKRETPQSQQADPNQIKNSAGGWSFESSIWNRFLRFLILGTEGGTYYISEKDLTLKAGEALNKCIKEDTSRVIKTIVDVSTNGRAPKNDPAIFALAVVFGSKSLTPETTAEAEDALLKVCRTGTDILHFCEFVQTQRGWGRALRRAVARWYGTRTRTPDDLAYTVLKYRQRDRWEQRDAIRLSHPTSGDPVKRALFALVAGKYDEKRYREALGENVSPSIVEGYFAATKATNEKEYLGVISKYKIPREFLPTEALTPKVWGALLETMPIHATLRNLGNLSKNGLLEPFSNGEKTVLSRFNENNIRKGRVHPLQVLIAMKTYSQGHGMRGKGTWSVNSRIVDMLDKSFDLGFQNVEPINQRIQLALDVSGSMSSGDVAGCPGLTPRAGSAALAMMLARREPNHYIMAFSSTFVPINISPRERLDDIINRTNSMPFSGTDCSLPMVYALQKKIPTDLFVIITDNETWQGVSHPHQALKKYREQMGINSKLCTIAMTSNSFTIADPNDPGQLDVCGFDSSIHSVISEFARL